MWEVEVLVYTSPTIHIHPLSHPRFSIIPGPLDHLYVEVIVSSILRSVGTRKGDLL